MSDYQRGRVDAIFAVGSRIEHLSEACNVDLARFDAMKEAYAAAIDALTEHRRSLTGELAKAPVKEMERALRCADRCIDTVKRLHSDVESRRLQTLGAHAFSERMIASVKRSYDEERSKLVQQTAWENDPSDHRLRPVGSPPGNPLDDYKRESPLTGSIVV